MGGTRRREIFIGLPGSPPKRVRLDDLEEIVRQVREAVEAIADDLGIPEDKRTPVELVDLLGGSTGLALEQVVPEAARQAPLAVLTDAAADRAHGRPVPKYLTARSLKVVDETVTTFARLASRGRPVRVRSYDDAQDEPTPLVSVQGRPGSQTASPSPLPIAARGPREVEFPATVPPPPVGTGAAYEVQTPSLVEPGRWLVEMTGKVERLYDDTKKLTLRTDRRLVGPLQLDDEQFLAVDGDGVRWKTARVRALSSAPELRGDSAVLDIIAWTGDPISSAVPATAAAAAMQPVLDKITAFRALDPGWDSYGAMAPRAAAVADAEKLVLSLAMRGDSGAPFAAPVPGGSVQLEWETDAAYLEFEFFGGGQIKAFRMHGEDEVLEERVSRERALELVSWFGGLA